MIGISGFCLMCAVHTGCLDGLVIESRMDSGLVD